MPCSTPLIPRPAAATLCLAGAHDCLRSRRAADIWLALCALPNRRALYDAHNQLGVGAMPKQKDSFFRQIRERFEKGRLS